MDEKHSLVLIVVGLGEGFGDVFELNDLSSVSACRFDVVARRAAMCEHYAAAPKHLAGVRHCLRMISAADSSNPSAPRVIEFGQNIIASPATFEVSSGL